MCPDRRCLSAGWIHWAASAIGWDGTTPGSYAVFGCVCRFTSELSEILFHIFERYLTVLYEPTCGDSVEDEEREIADSRQWARTRSPSQSSEPGRLLLQSLNHHRRVPIYLSLIAGRCLYRQYSPSSWRARGCRSSRSSGTSRGARSGGSSGKGSREG